MPNSQENKQVLQYNGTEWVNSGESDLIDVDTLPTENIDNSKVYRTIITKYAPDSYVYGAAGGYMTAKERVEAVLSSSVVTYKEIFVDSIDDVSEPVFFEYIEDNVVVPVYIDKGSGIGYVFGNNEGTIVKVTLSQALEQEGQDKGIAEDTSQIVEYGFYLLKGEEIKQPAIGVPNAQNEKAILEYDGDEWVEIDPPMALDLRDKSEPQVLYTVVIDKYDSNPVTRCTYANDCAEFTSMENVDNVINTNSWSNAFPFNKIKPCVLENGVFKGYVKQDDFTLYENGTPVNSDADDARLDVMIEIPKIYYFIENKDGKINVNISNKKVDDNYCCYAHVYDGIECDNIYIGAYTSIVKQVNNVDTFFSATNILLANTNTIKYSNYYKYTEQKADGYRQLNFDQVTLLQCLFMLAFKSTDSSGSFAFGSVRSVGVFANGYHDKNGMYCGNLTEVIPNKFMGIENIYGNMFQRVEGIHINSRPFTTTYEVYKRDPYSSVAINNEGTDYEFIQNNPELDNLYVNKIPLINPYANNVLGFLPQSRYLDGEQGTYTTYFCDTIDLSTYRGMWWGGDQKWGSNYTGIFCFKSDTGSTSSNNYHAYRLVYYPIGGEK